MRIAINAADLDHSRIDGTRIYIQNLLKNFGLLNKEDQFLIYHRSQFNPELTFPIFENYQIRSLRFPFWWTQTRFAWEIFCKKPDVLWMPMHSLPCLRSRKTKTVVTIHDLAFKFFPEHFPKKDLHRLNFFTDHAVRHADKIISVSNSTKNDLLKVYPTLRKEKIKVIYHGYDKELYNSKIDKGRIMEVRNKYKIPYAKYFIYLGAIQPRKNVGLLIDAFEIFKKDARYENVGLVIAGELGWLYGNVVKKIENAEQAMATGKFHPQDSPALLAGSVALVLPSLYEGFGLPALEAMACGTPVVAADNSSLAEITGEYGLLFKDNDASDLAEKLKRILDDEKLRENLGQKGLERAKHFSWEKCARETLDWLKF